MVTHVFETMILIRASYSTGSLIPAVSSTPNVSVIVQLSDYVELPVAIAVLSQLGGYACTSHTLHQSLR